MSEFFTPWEGYFGKDWIVSTREDEERMKAVRNWTSRERAVVQIQAFGRTWEDILPKLVDQAEAFFQKQPWEFIVIQCRPHVQVMGQNVPVEWVVEAEVGEVFA